MKLRKILLLVIASAAAGARAQFSHTHAFPTSAVIPPSGTGGAPGGASNPANVATASILCTSPIFVERVEVSIDITHTAVGNLRIELEHCGTTVLLYDQSPQSNANLIGVYEFDSLAPVTFASAVQSTPANGTVPAGTYAPASSLGLFHGTSSGGQWNLKISDLVSNDVGILSGGTVVFHGGQVYPSSTAPGPIPDGLNGECLAPVTQVINVPDHGPIGDVIVDLNIYHPYASDLDISIQHLGVSVLLSEAFSPASSADLVGWYVFSDLAVDSWTAAETQYAGSAIPSAGYRPKEALAPFRGLDKYGTWYVTVCDRALGDLGSLNQPAQIRVTTSPYHLTISQPNGSASVTLANTGGKQGDVFVNLFTLTPGNVPFGWLFGLDISMFDLVTQLWFGPPFVGGFDACGNSSFTIAGPIPQNLTVWCVSIQMDGSWRPLAIDGVRSYTTSP